MQSVIEVSGLSKTYASGLQALKPVNLSIRKGEIFALLGPNGAGKTTLISIICGIVRRSAGTVTVVIEIIDGDTFLMSFDTAASIGALGTVDDSDIVQFDATSLGTNTVGSFSFYFDGSGTITPYVDVDGTGLVARTPVSITLSGLEEMHLVFGVKAGPAGNAETLQMDYIRCLQLR